MKYAPLDNARIGKCSTVSLNYDAGNFLGVLRDVTDIIGFTQHRVIFYLRRVKETEYALSVPYANVKLSWWWRLVRAGVIRFSTDDEYYKPLPPVLPEYPPVNGKGAKKAPDTHLKYMCSRSDLQSTAAEETDGGRRVRMNTL